MGHSARRLFFKVAELAPPPGVVLLAELPDESDPEQAAKPTCLRS